MVTGSAAPLLMLRSGVAVAVAPTIALVNTGYTTGDVECSDAIATVSVPVACCVPSVTTKVTRRSVPAPPPAFRTVIAPSGRNDTASLPSVVAETRYRSSPVGDM